GVIRWRLDTAHADAHRALASRRSPATAPTPDSACADETIARCLVDRQTPAPGTVCEQDIVPFRP
ncbi:MAG: hypothetical protein M3P44_07575, partial [Actinomycetota bacterium]|nr:hypothetical protein [Actinomycetota bacterium]